MKNNKMTWILLLLWMVGLWYMMKNKPQQQAVVLPKPDVAMEQVLSKEKAAGQNATELNKVIKDYQRIAKQYGKTEDAAKARLRIGIIQETKLAKQDKKQVQAAVQTYTALVRAFPPVKSEAGKEAERRLTVLQKDIDRRNSQQLGYKIIDTLVAATGRNPKFSYAIALLIITLAVKVLTAPLSSLQFKYMKEMQKIQPLVKQLQVKYKGKQQELGQKTMALYKEHGVNPFSSCLPLLVQMPVLILLYYKVILAYQYQFGKGELLWIGSSLAQKFPAIVAANLSQPDIPLLLIYTVSMIISQKLTIVDPTQADQQKVMAYMMPIMFAFMFKSFPSALMLYWLLFNVASTVHQYLILKPTAGTAGPTGTTGGEAGGPPPPVEPPKRPPTSPGKAKKRRRRFDALVLPKPAIS